MTINKEALEPAKIFEKIIMDIIYVNCKIVKITLNFFNLLMKKI